MIVQNDLIETKYSTIKGLYTRNTKRLFNALFQWSGLPKGLKSLHIEKFLFDYGVVSIFKLPGTDKIYVLPATMQEWDIYGDMKKAYVFSPYKGAGGIVTYDQGNSKDFGKGKAAVQTWNVSVEDIGDKEFIQGCFIKNNLESTPTLFGSNSTLNLMDNIFKQLERDVFNSRNQRIFGVASTDDAKDVEEAIGKLNSSVNLYETVNIGTSAILESRVKVFDSPSKQKDFWENFKQTEQLFRKNLGIPYDSRPEKKERVLEAEINASQLENALLISDMLEMRLEAVKSINKLFNSNIEVKLTKEVEALISSFNDTMISNEAEKENNNIRKEEE